MNDRKWTQKYGWCGNCGIRVNVERSSCPNCFYIPLHITPTVTDPSAITPRSYVCWEKSPDRVKRKKP